MKTKFSLPVMVVSLLISGCGKDPLFTDAGTFTDARDNHVYKSVKIGDQIWMTENLAYLPSVSPSSAGSDSSLFYYVYGYQGSSVSEAKATTNYNTYGVLYNWEAAKTACPSGWHLPGDEDWQILTDLLNGSGYTSGGKMKETGTGHWLSPNTGATNESGFTALPGGERSHSGTFNEIGYYGELWTSLEFDALSAWVRVLMFNLDVVHPDTSDRSDGLSVRCLKD